MFNTFVVVALICLIIWNLIQRNQIKHQEMVIERIKHNSAAFEIRTMAIDYYREHGTWPTIKELRVDRDMDSLECTLWADWQIKARFEKNYTKQWLLEIWIPGANVCRIFHTGIRTAA